MEADKATQLPFIPHHLPPSTLDTRLTRLYKVLSTSSGVDATLHLVGYTSFLVSSQIPRLQTLLSSPGSSKHAAQTIAKLTELQTSTKTLASMCTDFRTFTRLWGLLGIYAMAKRNYLSPPKDAVLRALAYSQTAALGAYYVYENGYYLAGKGVLHGWTPAKIKTWAKASLNMFLAYVLLESVRLARVRQLRVKREGIVSAKERAALENEDNAWNRGVVMNAIWTPLSFHWATEGGLLSEGVVGMMMTAAGLIKFRTAWAAAV